jgi:hypothetical protein
MHKQCLTNAFSSDSDVVVGVIAGVSEYERLIIKFQKDG